jgi:outer membrane protein
MAFKGSTLRLVTVLVCLIIGTLVFVAPRTSPTHRAFKTEAYMAKFQLAMTYIENAKMPMQEILQLRKLAEDVPNRPEAPFQLGVFSMKTGQHQKAVKWFSRTLPYLQGEQKAAALANMADAYAMQGKSDSAVVILKQVFDISKDSLLLRSISVRIKELETK